MTGKCIQVLSPHSERPGITAIPGLSSSLSRNLLRGVASLGGGLNRRGVATRALAMELGRLVRPHDIAALEPWLSSAAGSDLPELRDFAAGLLRHEAAVRAAIELPRSNGQTEGQVNRLKLLAHLKDGWASVGLLRQRLLHAAGGSRRSGDAP